MGCVCRIASTKFFDSLEFLDIVALEMYSNTALSTTCHWYRSLSQQNKLNNCFVSIDMRILIPMCAGRIRRDVLSVVAPALAQPYSFCGVVVAIVFVAIVVVVVLSALSDCNAVLLPM